MAPVGTGHHHLRFHAPDGISRKTRLTRSCNAAVLMCLVALIAAMWTSGNLLALMHAPLMGGISSLGAVTTLACTSTALSLIGLIEARFSQLRMEQVNALAT